jgi:uncharacterized protein
MPVAAQVSYAAMSLDELARYLSSDDAPPHCMLLSELDGFLTGIAVGPDPVMPSEWLPIVWGGVAPAFADDGLARAVHDAIIGRYEEIVADVKDDTVQPILWRPRDGTVIASDWAEGFVEAMAFRPRKWERLAKSDASVLLMPIMLLLSDEMADTDELLVDLSPGEKIEVKEEAAANLDMTVSAIANYWQMSASEKASLNAGIRASVKVGRNDPCPCGSGKKFKKCCAAGL